MIGPVGWGGGKIKQFLKQTKSVRPNKSEDFVDNLFAFKETLKIWGVNPDSHNWFSLLQGMFRTKPLLRGLLKTFEILHGLS